MNKRSVSQRTRKTYGKGHYRGVNWDERAKSWQVSLRVKGKIKYIGYFKDEEDGLTAINSAYARYFPDNPELQQKTYKETLINENKLICGKW